MELKKTCWATISQIALMASLTPPVINGWICIKAAEATVPLSQEVCVSQSKAPPLPETHLQSRSAHTGRAGWVHSQVMKNLQGCCRDLDTQCVCDTVKGRGVSGKKISCLLVLINKVRSEWSVWRRELIELFKDNFKGRLVSGLRAMGVSGRGGERGRRGDTTTYAGLLKE